LLIDSGNSIGNNLERVGTIVLLGAAAPTGGLQVTLTVASGPVSLSNATADGTTGVDAGHPSITVTIPYGASSGTYYMYGLSTTGSAIINATAPGYASTSGTETLTPSGVVIGSVNGFGPPNIFITPLASANQPLNISTAQLDTSGNFIQTMALAGTASLTVSLTNTNAGVGTVPGSVSVPPGNDTSGNPLAATATFHPVAMGATMIGVTQPAGFSIPTDGSATLTVNVQ
ncbi:MAG TPA: hypothetical protein VI455_20115, partial [Terriglobia bacterium]